MSDKAPDAVLVCKCGSRTFYAVPDGADSWLAECAVCGWKGEIGSRPGVTLSLVEARDPVSEAR